VKSRKLSQKHFYKGNVNFRRIQVVKIRVKEQQVKDLREVEFYLRQKVLIKSKLLKRKTSEKVTLSKRSLLSDLAIRTKFKEKQPIKYRLIQSSIQLLIVSLKTPLHPPLKFMHLLTVLFMILLDYCSKHLNLLNILLLL
jgi:hypothetical protein